jgi:hypothetical protein
MSLRMATPVLFATPAAKRALALAPLLASIGREIRQRSDALSVLLVERQRARCDQRVRTLLDAECATHRRELRRTYKELERLGCELVGSRPHAFRVEAGPDHADSVLFWCSE